MKLIVLGAGFHHSVRQGEEPNRDVLRLVSLKFQPSQT